MYCVSHLFYDTIKSNDTTNPKKYEKYLEQIKIPKGQKYPIDILKDIPKYEKLNGIKINLYEFPDNKYDESPSVLYNTKDKQLEKKACNLLLLTNGDKELFVRIITNFSGLLRKEGDKL